MSKAEEGTGQIHPNHAAAMTRGSWYPDMSAYGHYRFMMVAASSPNKSKASPAGPIGEHPFSVAYSKVDQDIINFARKVCGMEELPLGPGDSRESEDVHKISPMHGKTRPPHWHTPSKTELL